MASPEQALSTPQHVDEQDRSMRHLEAAYDFLSSHHPFRKTFQKVYDRMYDKITLSKEEYGQRYYR